MKFFKISPESNEDLKVNREKFEIARLQNPNLHQNDICYGICPYCDSPVQLLGIFRKIETKPYGKHCGKDIPNVGRHHQSVFEYCPYNSHKRAVSKTDRRKDVTERDIKIYNLIKEHFDQIIYILKKDCDVYISHGRARKILEMAKIRTVWQYPEIDEANLPWIILYLYDEINIYGQYIRIDSELHKALIKHNIKFEPEDKVKGFVRVGKQDKNITWNYSFAIHKRYVNKDGCFKEYIKAVVTKPNLNGLVKIYEKKIPINHQRFYNLMNSENAPKYRNEELLKIAQEVFSDELKLTQQIPD